MTGARIRSAAGLPGLMSVGGAVCLRAQAPAGSVGPRPNVGPADRPIVSPAAVERGARVWSAECVTCHGASARGTEQAPESRALAPRAARSTGQSGRAVPEDGAPDAERPAERRPDRSAEIGDVIQFLRQRINDTLRGSPLFGPGNIVTGDAAAGAAYFAGEGGCTACHSPAGDLKGLATRYSATRSICSSGCCSRWPRGLLAASGGGAAAPNRTAITVTLTSRAGAPVSGHPRRARTTSLSPTVTPQASSARSGATPGLTVVIDDPLRAHREWLDRVSDKNIHDLVAYLVTLK